MKEFYTTLFGGLGAILIGMALVWGSGHVWSAVSYLSYSGPAAAADAASADPNGTIVSVSGVSRTVRYTATEEEDMINQAASSLPSGADGRVTAAAYLVKDLTTHAVAASYNADRLLPIASLTKLVTAVEARRLITPNTKITITPDVMTTYGNTAGFKEGETFTASDLLYPLLMVSSNDAAEAYAQSYGRAAFISAMNQFVQSIGAYRTYFADPSGLSPMNESTANDMAIILGWISKNDPTVIETTDLHAKTIRSHTWLNPTHFLSWSYYIGGKNGYTDEAKSTGASLFEAGLNKDTYAIVVLGSDNRDADVIKLLAKIK